MNLAITTKHNSLSKHPMYQSLTSIENVRTFMQYHVFAVWDFMSLLKSLQRQITCVDIPWNNSKFDPEIVRLVNEIVLGEESDIDQNGNAISHFALYLKAMDEIGADNSLIKKFIDNYDLEPLPDELKNIVSFHLDIALDGKVHEVASSFFYGREKLIPEMFQSVVDVLDKAQMDCPTLKYYLERHIELDGDDHGPKAQKCLSQLLDSQGKKQEAISMAIKSLDMRWRLWDFIQQEMKLKH
jgi:hypothetical protein